MILLRPVILHPRYFSSPSQIVCVALDHVRTPTSAVTLEDPGPFGTASRVLRLEPVVCTQSLAFFLDIRFQQRGCCLASRSSKEIPRVLEPIYRFFGFRARRSLRLIFSGELLKNRRYLSNPPADVGPARSTAVASTVANQMVPRGCI